MISGVYIYQDVLYVVFLSMAAYCTECMHPPGHPMSAIMLCDMIKGTSPYIWCVHVCVCMYMPRYVHAYILSRVPMFMDFSVQNFDVS